MRVEGLKEEGGGRWGEGGGVKDKVRREGVVEVTGFRSGSGIRINRKYGSSQMMWIRIPQH